MKMEEINKIIRDLWRSTYRGQGLHLHTRLSVIMALFSWILICCQIFVWLFWDLLYTVKPKCIQTLSTFLTLAHIYTVKNGNKM